MMNEPANNLNAESAVKKAKTTTKSQAASSRGKVRRPYRYVDERRHITTRTRAGPKGKGKGTGGTNDK